MKLFLSPHNDDEALFGAFTIQREKPLVLIVTDSYRQFQRGQALGSPTIRRQESIAGMGILGAAVAFLGIPDVRLTEETLLERLDGWGGVFPADRPEDGFGIEKVYAPAYYMNGNEEHNIVSKVAERVFGDRVVYYSTYRKDDLEPKGDVEIVGTPEEVEKKEAALMCYVSQLMLTPEHFRVVKGKSEFYVH